METNVSGTSVGWFFVKFICKLSEDERSRIRLTKEFNDWVFYDGEKWDASEYSEFYISEIIKGEKEG